MTKKDGKWILLVDDEEDVRVLLNKALTREAKLKGINLVIVEAVDGAEASEKVKDQFFDCIVTDLQMPNLTGDIFIKAVQMSDLNYNTPIIVLSGFVNNEFKTFSLIYEHIKFLDKPCSPGDIVKSVFNELKHGKKDSRVSLLLMNPFLRAVQEKLEETKTQFKVLKPEVLNEVEEVEDVIHCCLNIANGNQRFSFIISIETQMLLPDESTVTHAKYQLLTTAYINTIFKMASVHLDICLGGLSRLVGITITSPLQGDHKILGEFFKDARVSVKIKSGIGNITLHAISRRF